MNRFTKEDLETIQKFTPEQIDYICYQIGDWYMEWKPIIIDWNNKTHRLGFAKEQLKAKICGEIVEDFLDE